MSICLPKLSQFLLPVKNITPNSVHGDSDFTYIDISSVDRDSRSIVTPQVIQTSVAPSRARQELMAGDIIVSTVRPNLNTVAMVMAAHADAIASTGFCVLRPDFNRLDPRYLYHWVSSEATVRRLVSLATGATYPAVSDKIIKSLELNLPTLLEQKRIATILDKAESLRHKRQEAVFLADDFLRAVFLDMFGDPVSNPRGWVTSSIIDLCSLATGGTPNRDEPSYFDGPHPWVKTGEVDSDWIIASEEHISDRAISESNCKLFPPKTILVAMYGQGKTRGKVGMLGMTAATNQACAAILPSEKINSYFLLAQLRLMYDHLRAMGRGGNQENLNLGMIKSLKVLVPPPELVTNFIDILQHATKVKSKAVSGQNEINLLAMSFSSKFFA